MPLWDTKGTKNTKGAKKTKGAKIGGKTMNLHVDRETAQLSAETRRLWDDVRVWMMNCVAIEAAWPPGTHAERERARRGCDLMLAAIAEAW